MVHIRKKLMACLVLAQNIYVSNVLIHVQLVTIEELGIALHVQDYINLRLFII